MNLDFTVTDINRIIFVDDLEYPNQKIDFNRPLNYHELIFTFSGHKIARFNGTELLDRANSIRYLPQGPVSGYSVERLEPGPCIDIFFSTDRPISDGPFVLQFGQNSRFATLFQTIFSTWVAKEEGYRFTCLSLLYTILAQMNRQNYSSDRQHQRIKPVADYIHENFLRGQITSQALSEVGQMSYSYLKRLFTARYGLSPKQYVIQLKLNHACDLLRAERYSVTEAAEQCGFRDVYFFSKQFKEHMGISPSQFARKYRSSK